MKNFVFLQYHLTDVMCSTRVGVSHSARTGKEHTEVVQGTAGRHDAPPWDAVVAGPRPNPPDAGDVAAGISCRGWQHSAVRAVQEPYLGSGWPSLSLGEPWCVCLVLVTSTQSSKFSRIDSLRSASSSFVFGIHCFRRHALASVAVLSIPVAVQRGRVTFFLDIIFSVGSKPSLLPSIPPSRPFTRRKRAHPPGSHWFGSS